ncbi:unnamed protein product, partial [Prorocentrum cordatum]
PAARSSSAVGSAPPRCPAAWPAWAWRPSCTPAPARPRSPRTDASAPRTRRRPGRRRATAGPAQWAASGASAPPPRGPQPGAGVAAAPPHPRPAALRARCQRWRAPARGSSSGSRRSSRSSSRRCDLSGGTGRCGGSSRWNGCCRSCRRCSRRSSTRCGGRGGRTTSSGARKCAWKRRALPPPAGIRRPDISMQIVS